MLRDKGFTLVELMVVLAVFAFLTLVATPGFGRLATEQRIITSTNSLLSALNLTRSEAIRRGQRVSLCPSTDGETCSADTPYDHGWIVFAGPPEGEPLDVAGPIIRYEPPMRTGISATGNGAMARYVSYLPTGQTRQLGGGLLMGRITLCNDGIGRSIVINRVGRPRVEDATCAA